ncbi:MAG: hypothetical protein HC836_23210 [Richelia sp. RM2_1_2]|nr:hypothetical protein [Richelia sp. RM2_1_2]
MARINIKQINNSGAIAGDAIVYNGTNNEWSAVSPSVPRIQELYVGKHGNDANPGTTPELAFLTFGSAITAATALTPSTSNRIRITCTDGGTYTESITVPAWVFIDATDTTLVGTLTMSSDSEAYFTEVFASTGVAVTKSGTGTARVSADVIRATGTANTITNTGTTGVLLIVAKQIFVENGVAVQDATSAVAGHIHVESEDLYITGAGTGIVSTGVGAVVGRLSHILEISGGIGNGTAFNISGGLVDVTAGRIEATTAYTVSGGTLRLIVNNLTGTRTQTTGAAVVDVLEANSLRWISITSADSPYVPRRIEYLNIDTTGGPITIDLPASASDGDAVYFQDATQNFSTNAVTFDANGNTIDGSLATLIISTNNRAGQLVFFAANNDWSYSTNTVGQSPSNLIYVTKNGNDASGDGSFDKPFLTVKKGIDTANLLATAILPVSVNVLDGVYDEDAMTMSNPYVTLRGNSETAVNIRPNAAVSPLFTMTSTVAGIGPTIDSVTLVQPVTNTGTAIFASGDGRFVVQRTPIANFLVGVDAGNGVISAPSSQEMVYDFGVPSGNGTAFLVQDQAKLALQIDFLRNNGVGINAIENAIVELGNFDIQGAETGQAGTGIILSDSATLLANSGRIHNLSTGLIVNDTSSAQFTATFFDTNTNDFNQVDGTAEVLITSGSLTKNSLLIADGANVGLNYLENDSADFIIGSVDSTGTPGLEFRVRQIDGRIAVGDQATNAHIASGGVGGSRTFNLIDTNGNIRVWRYTGTSNDPAVELIHGINPANTDGDGDAPIVSITAGTDTIVIDVSGADYNDPLAPTPGIDRTTLAERAFPAGRQFRVNGTGSNNADFTVASATYNSGPQTISIVTTQDITVSEGAVGTVVFGGGPGRPDGVSTFVGNPAAAIAAGAGNAWWDFFLQEDDSFRIRRRAGGIGEGSGNKARFFLDRSEFLGSTLYDESDQFNILTLQSTASAAAYTTINNGTAVLGPQIIATGAAADIPIRIDPKGTGRIVLDGVQWPAADGTSNQVLATDGAGSAFWTTITPGTGTVTSVAATAPAAGFTISGSPITTSGTFTFALANDLAALEALATSGFAARTGTDTWAIRSLTAPAAGLTITNPAGTAGNPTFALANDLAALRSD